MLPIQWRTEAQTDLTRILGYLAERSQQAAFDLYNNIDQVVSQLPQHPYLYRCGRVAGTRELVVHPNYVIVYQIGTASIEIISVLHARQQYP